ncbi:MAG: hypothetical protein GY857_09390, partial [Desulfobacula sp.]|nr:hypothetical protein [Desulfobacula sp.]
ESKDIELDDLSALIDTSSDVGESEPDKPEQDMDDLSALIDDSLSKSTEFEQLDDLSLLIDSQPGKKDKKKSEDTKEPANEFFELDDLSKLIDEPLNQKSQDMDDLSQLIDDESDNDQQPGQELDDLDNLALLIESDSPETDDLSKLISDDPEPANDVPEIKVDISPEEDMGKYKAAIMKIIIGLKTDGIDVEETTDRLNKNSIKTLSGKPEWTQKAISQIYKFIDSAQ